MIPLNFILNPERSNALARDMRKTLDALMESLERAQRGSGEDFARHRMLVDRFSAMLGAGADDRETVLSDVAALGRAALDPSRPVPDRGPVSRGRHGADDIVEDVAGEQPVQLGLFGGTS